MHAGRLRVVAPSTAVRQPMPITRACITQQMSRLIFFLASVLNASRRPIILFPVSLLRAPGWLRVSGSGFDSEFDFFPSARERRSGNAVNFHENLAAPPNLRRVPTTPPPPVRRPADPPTGSVFLRARRFRAHAIQASAAVYSWRAATPHCPVPRSLQSTTALRVYFDAG